MDYQALQATFKRDLQAIPKLKLGILIDRDLYGPLAVFVLKLSLLLLSINVAIQAGLYSINFFYYPPSLALVLTCWAVALVGSILMMMFASSFILFGKMVEGRLESAAFIKEKCRQFGIGFLVLYSIAYFFLIMSFYSTESLCTTLDYLIFILAFSQFVVLVGSMLIVNVFAGIEINRLGLGVAFEVIDAFSAKLTSHDDESNQGDDDR